ncbi:MAG: hypothetical protein RSB37_06005, partial [Acetivibrio sp.]
MKIKKTGILRYGILAAGVIFLSLIPKNDYIRASEETLPIETIGTPETGTPETGTPETGTPET